MNKRKKVLATPLEKYFSRARLLAQGMDQKGATKLLNSLFHRTKFATVGELVEAVDCWGATHQDQITLKHFGVRSIKIFQTMLREDGVTVP